MCVRPRHYHEEKRNVLKNDNDSRRREIKLGYCAKMNGRSTIIGPEYIATIRPLGYVE